jgi:predicted nuclease with TOPRIM domain
MNEDIARLIKSIQDKNKEKERLINEELNLQADIDSIQVDLDEVEKTLASLDQEISDDEDELLSLLRPEQID